MTNPVNNTAAGQLIAAELSQAAYIQLSQYQNMPNPGLPQGWIADTTHNRSASDASGNNQFITFVNSSTQQIVIAFKGSNDAENFTSDLLNDGAAAYADIATQAQAALTSIKAAYPGYTIVTDGHSLGGGMAQTFSVANNLSGYGQNSLPIAANTIIGINNSTIKTPTGANFSSLLNTWKTTTGNYFEETNSVGDIATGNYTARIAQTPPGTTADYYLYTPPTGLVATPYTNQILNGLKIINQTTSSPSIFTPMLVDTGAAWSSFAAINAHSIVGVVAGLQQIVAGTASFVPNISTADMTNLMKYFNASAGTLNSNGSGTVTEPDGSQFNWNVPVITDGAATFNGTATGDNLPGNFGSLTFSQPSANQTVVTSTLSDGTKGTITFTANTDGSSSIAFVHDNSNGTVQFTQTNTISASGQLTAVAVSGTGDNIALSNNVSLTLAQGASVSVIEPASYEVTEAVTYDTASGKSVTFGAGTTAPESQYSDSGTVYAALDAPDGLGLGTLAFNTATNAASFTLIDGLTFALPAIAVDTIAALGSTVSPYAALKDYLADLGYTGNVASLDSAYQNPTGSSYSVTGQVTGFSPEGNGKTYAVVGYTPGAPGASMIGQNSAMYNGTTYDAYNYIYVSPGGTSDLTNDTWSNMQALTLTSSTAELTGAQFAGFSNLTGNGQIVFTTAGSYSLAGDAADNGLFSLTAQSWGGTTLTGDATNYQTLTASLYGNDTLNAGSGTGDVLVAGEGVDTITAGSGGDIIYALNGLAAGSRVTGNLATPDAIVASGDISGATITNQRYITIGNGTATSVGMTAAQLAGFTGGIYLGASTVGINAAGGGTFNLLNAPLVGASGSDRIMLNAISNAATTLTGDDTASATGYVSTLIASGNGNDTLTTGGDAGDSLSATGNGNDSLAAGNGNNDALSASGNGNDTLSAGSGAGDSLSATGNGNNTLTAGGGAADSLSASGTGTNILVAGNGAGDTLTAFNGSDTLTCGSGNGDILTANTGGNTLNAGSGTGDVLIAMGGGNILNGGNGGDTFSISDDANQATGGSGNDTFYLEGSSQAPTGDLLTLDLAGSVISGGGGVDTLVLDNTQYDSLDVSAATLSGIEVITGMQHLTIKGANDNVAMLLRPGANDDCALQITLLKVV